MTTSPSPRPDGPTQSAAYRAWLAGLPWPVMAERLAAGEPPAAVGRDYGISGKTVQRHFAQTGIPPERNHQRHLLPIEPERIRAEYADGTSVTTLAVRYHASLSTIGEALGWTGRGRRHAG
ncbi:hypothetical protein FHX74_003434 [Friedmanniella endophytica]|uniref:Helix-turn-helix domain-containing protein n=1 Tax=Microlunatus kandeliicorticis TaxID=1759536 RepID=A0A7W3P799_9ACTN|nr:hypothetical protein [Microlunatus kandeliicorticis]MBA8795793.1 hypothetical protein [Microlunatus kandeliicorticis]